MIRSGGQDPCTYEFPFEYTSRPNWDTYRSLLDFAAAVRRDTRELKPRDMIDLQSFIWVQGSDEYPEGVDASCVDASSVERPAHP